ncbi:hypothetical protein [Kingella oralis]|uniref:hypothetical protein n=1 Tax=Kingella oralis TaxID=505 RepID=UPI0015F66E6D|nr:hypothetical protein [Kingella oralis]QMT43943.1 hypothetical protein H3L93_06420 [Kingella oralis]
MTRLHPFQAAVYRIRSRQPENERLNLAAPNRVSSCPYGTRLQSSLKTNRMPSNYRATPKAA